MESKQEFRVSQYITLKLEDKKSVIYVNQKRFIQCKSLLLNIHPEDGELIENIQSIDEAAEKLGRTPSDQLIPSREMNFELTPQVAFWGHCSNLQAWVEYDYDTRLLHSNLAFPLLKRLADEGDRFAGIRLQEEITERFLKGMQSTRIFLIEEKYLNYLDEENFNLLFDSLPKNFWLKLITYADNNIVTSHSEEKNIFYRELASHYRILKHFIKNLKEMDIYWIIGESEPHYLTDLINEADSEIINNIIAWIKFFEREGPVDTEFYWNLFFEAVKNPTPEFIKNLKKLFKRNDIEEFQILLKLRWLETINDIEFLTILKDSAVFFMEYLKIIIKDSLDSRNPRSNVYYMERFMGVIFKLQNIKEKEFWNRFINSLGDQTEKFFECLININDKGADKYLTNDPENVENYVIHIVERLKKDKNGEFLRCLEKYKKSERIKKSLR